MLVRTVIHSAMAEAEECTLQSPFTAAIADGVGGTKGGAAAARLTMEKLRGYHPTKRVPIDKKILSIHESIKEAGQKGRYGGAAGMQCTLCALISDEQGRFFAVNSGDSRIYRFRRGRLEQLSKDQSVVEILYDKGAISLEQKLTHADRNIILPVLGSLKRDPEPIIKDIGCMEQGDLLVMCTDGICDYVSAYEFEEILSRPARLPRRLAMLADAALSGGSRDNMTIVGLSYSI